MNGELMVDIRSGVRTTTLHLMSGGRHVDPMHDGEDVFPASGVSPLGGDAGNAMCANDRTRVAVADGFDKAKERAHHDQ